MVVGLQLTNVSFLYAKQRAELGPLEATPTVAAERCSYYSPGVVAVEPISTCSIILVTPWADGAAEASLISGSEAIKKVQGRCKVSSVRGCARD
jgi:hypothetical protein